MYKLKLNPTSLSFLPILIFIPICINLINNIHFGGINLISEFILSAFMPKINISILITVFNRLNETVLMAIGSWFFSIIFGIILGILSSNILYEILDLPIIFGKLIKIILTLIRSINEIIWGLLLMQIYGINISVGIISICIPYIAINAKVINEQLDIIDRKIIESILKINGNKLSSLLTLIWNPLLETIRNFGFYRLECALRSTTILGLFGLGGIGTSIYLSFKALSFRELWTYLWSLGLLLIIFKFIFKFNVIKRVNFKVSFFTCLVLFTLSICSLFYFFEFLLAPSYAIKYSINNLYLLRKDFISYNFLKLIFETILLSISASAIAISLPPFLSIVLINKFWRYFVSGLSFFFRLIPPPITILILLMFNEPSISLAALSLGIYNASIINKLLTKNLNYVELDQVIALDAIGAKKRISWLYGLFSKQAKSYLIYCLYRTDILIRDTALVGIIGSIGLGWQLQESISSFAWEEVSIILLSYSLIVIIGELINDKIKKNLI